MKNGLREIASHFLLVTYDNKPIPRLASAILPKVSENVSEKPWQRVRNEVF
jgi:hypothetical protein